MSAVDSRNKATACKDFDRLGRPSVLCSDLLSVQNSENKIPACIYEMYELNKPYYQSKLRQW
jgi:hypothetical protein